MNKKFLIPIIVLIIVGIGYMFWNAGTRERISTESNQSTNSSTLNSTQQSTQSGQPGGEADRYTVRLTSEGFEPSTLTVPPGVEVTFINQTDGDMWVASDPHPQHTDYGDFDQKQGGDSYTFTFSESGAFTYHNHLNPSQTGLILVE